MTMDRKSSAALPQDMAGAVNLLAHPVAGAAAMSALGIGLASHAFGAWMGTLSAAMAASQRLIDAMGRERAVEQGGLAAPAGKARATVRAVMRDAHAYARDIAQGKDSGADDVTGQADRPGTARAVVSAEPASAFRTPRQPVATGKPAKPDNLKAIAGIGPKLEAVLNGLGIWTYGQIAAWRDEDVAWIEEYFGFSGRIAHDGWIEQAAALGRQAKGAGSN
jgi:NADH-quinone oxidoreductase subunit E